MSKDMQKQIDEAKKKKLPHRKKATRKWAGIHGACTVCGCAIHECECK